MSVSAFGSVAPRDPRRAERGRTMERRHGFRVLCPSRRDGQQRQEDHEISMLALHLIQNCMVYVNTLMIHKVLAQAHWQGKLTPPRLRRADPADLGAREPLLVGLI